MSDVQPVSILLLKVDQIAFQKINLLATETDTVNFCVARKTEKRTSIWLYDKYEKLLSNKP